MYNVVIVGCIVLLYVWPRAIMASLRHTYPINRYRDCNDVSPLLYWLNFFFFHFNMYFILFITENSKLFFILSTYSVSVFLVWRLSLTTTFIRMCKCCSKHKIFSQNTQYRKVYCTRHNCLYLSLIFRVYLHCYWM